MDSDIEDWMERIEMNCKLIYNRLEQGMNQELWEEFLDQNAKLMKFLKFLKDTPTERFVAMLEQIEAIPDTKDFGQFMDKMVI